MKRRPPVGDRPGRDPRPTERPSALADAVSLLARRPLTEREVRGRLSERGHPDDEIDRAVTRLRERGAVDDAALARHWCEVRASRRGHGPARLIRELEGRGVAPDVARRAMESAVDDGVVDPGALLRREADRRVGRLRGERDRRAYARVYNALLRAGFEPGAIHDALTPHFSDRGESTTGSVAGTGTEDHDLE